MVCGVDTESASSQSIHHPNGVGKDRPPSCTPHSHLLRSLQASCSKIFIAWPDLASCFPPFRCCAQGVATCIGGYDLVSGVRQGRVDVKSPPIALMFSRDGSLLVVATAVGSHGCERCRGAVQHRCSDTHGIEYHCVHVLLLGLSAMQLTSAMLFGCWDTTTSGKLQLMCLSTG
jgi:hypothetical protein